MKLTIIAAAVLMVAGACRMQNAPPRDVLQDETQQQEIIHAIVGDHSMMLKLIDEIKKSEHASMMIHHLLTSGDSSAMENCPMNANNVTNDAAKSPYAGEETRTIKSLSPDEIQKYLDGEGMGLAKAAELNHYPGPRHVLALASELHLTGEQKDKTQDAFNIMHEKAVSLGKQIVDKEKNLNKQFADGTVTAKVLESSTLELANLQGTLRATHLLAHIRMRDILTDEQAKKYDEMRGYRN